MKQTAVEWLTKQISSSKYFYKLMEEIESRSTIVQPNGILQQAKAMEREHMIGFHKWMLENDTEQNAEKHFHFTDNDMLDEYYNETFKSE